MGVSRPVQNFAADDDSNGPMFFIRSLEDCKDLRSFSAQDVADALLNYAPYEHGFFWWGGYGVSTEHTAYLNLRNGIPAPRSGSVEQNGSTMAEQIGGQIFIDPGAWYPPATQSRRPAWRKKPPASPTAQRRVGRRLCGLRHQPGLCGAQPGIRPGKGPALHPPGLRIRPGVRAVTAFYREHPDNWRECFQYVHDNFGYDKYPGNCHIIPNAAVMILSMLYGGGDFAKTLCICNMCGWDTDCNVGNVGCIMGVHCGLEGIDYDKWRAPINDFLACSSAVPSLNAMDVPYGAAYFAKMAYRLAGETPLRPGTSCWERAWRAAISSSPAAPTPSAAGAMPCATFAIRRSRPIRGAAP